MKLALYFAARLRGAKQSNRYISFISLSSSVGVGLGCFVLILLLSIMNGFERELTHRILSFIPHGELFAIDRKGIENWQAQQEELKADPRIKTVTPYTKITGMVQFKGKLKAAEITGIEVEEQPRDWPTQVSEKTWQAFQNNPYSVLLGKGIMMKLNIVKGDSIQFLVPTQTADLSFKAPQTVSLEVAGSIAIGGELDNLIGLMHLDTASLESGIASGAQGLRIMLHDPFAANSVMREIGYAFPQAIYMSDWSRTQGHLYEDIQLVRVVVYIALTLVIAVACFNIVSTLVMAVREKRSAIAIMKTMGASDTLIKQIFMIQGLLNGLMGIALGTGAAVLVAPKLSTIVGSIENVLGIKVLSGDVYFINFLPSELHLTDVVLTVLVATLLCVLATLYPASKAAKVAPAAALNG
ncbi:lipoprotein-releasing ABC transporter permease subunit [Alteromonas sp. ASW11-130]|uniref:lipoprotein-releasing ABC transporter permease subunit n=1 Tax=Alteromonas sp. ASW11-130 TaxID=3015775 RepID=UPI002241E065|nr:lipoprotein-releasing ABC transporter permease subunit [Alteromonas sp. ASW11-130]MCW8091989.1 lipoprotein-releasing ABC transporter permease subunit [Alteromonas sp. ASW11-130]